MAHKLKITISRSSVEENEMKVLCILTFVAICFSMTGCSTLAHVMETNFTVQPGNDLLNNATAGQSLGRVQVYNSNPYTIHLEIEESDSLQESEPLNGDGGVSLNAYAACLTLKVIF
jgi:hypothetical protein